MQRKIHSWGPRALLAGGLGTLLALSTLVSADASSHREAPLISKDPVADNTDVYAFVAPDATDTVTLISNWEGFQEPGGGPNYFEFGDDVLYKIYVDNNGDAREDVTYEFRFSTKLAQPNTFLYAVGPITTPNDADMSRPQTYTVTKVQRGRRTTIATNVPTPPSNVGPRTTPNYAATAAQAITPLKGGGKVFAGQRDDGFYFDGASVFDLGALRPFLPGYEDGRVGIDTFAGYNVQSIAIQVPKSEIVSSNDPVIGVWSTAERQAVRVFRGNNGSQPFNAGRWVQVSRLGNPLVNEVVIPLKLKDAFNALEPEDDAATLSGVQAPPLSTEGDIPLLTDPILAELAEQIYGITTPKTPRDDLKTIYLTGIPGLNQPANVKPAELLRLNTSIDPTPFAQQNRLGLLAGQLDGFPNGRRVIDDVIDISLQAVAGATPLTPDFQKAPNNQLGDGVDGNDMPFLNTFPYLATPHQGTDLNNEARVR